MGLTRSYIMQQLAKKSISKEQAKNMLLELQTAARVSPGVSKDIAIVGMECRFAGAEDKWSFWNQLLEDKQFIREFPQNRRKDISAHIENLNQSAFKQGGYFENIDLFDAAFFHIPPTEADLMDPAQRILLETAYKAIVDAGMENKLSDTKTGVYVGVDTSDPNPYKSIIEHPDTLSYTGGITSILASRLSYLLNLKGPAVVVDSACSSGASALHFAITALRSGEIETAVVAGVSLQYLPVQQGMVESTDYHLRTFDQQANGTVWAEGVGALVLKNRAQCTAEKTQIYAVIKGSAINNDGAAASLIAPNAKAQTAVIVDAWKDAGIHPEQIDYIEAHGTATKLGDSIEIKGLTDAFRTYTKKRQFCGIGTLKTNVGHLVGASGIAACIKMAMAIYTGRIPKGLNIDRPNAFIPFADSPVYLQDCERSWLDKKRSERLCGLNCFGLSGTNSHIVMSGEVSVSEESRKLPSGNAAMFSAPSVEHLIAYMEAFCAFLKKTDCAIEDICYTLNTTRVPRDIKVAVSVSDREGLYRQLEKTICFLKNPAHGTVPCGVNLSRQLLREAREPGTNDENPSKATAACVSFVAGEQIEWERLYAGYDMRIVHIPPIVFMPERHWVKADETKKQKGIPISLESVCRIWGEQLGYPLIHPQENFFELGGDSIHAIRISNQFNELFEININFTNLLMYPTPEQFFQYCLSVQKTDKVALKQPDDVGAIGDYALSPGQKRMLILQKIDGVSTAYNLVFAYKIEKSLDMERFDAALCALVKRHDTLRTSFHLMQGNPVQRIHDDVTVEYETIELKRSEMEAYLSDCNLPFDLSCAPLFWVIPVKTSDTKEFFLAFNMHHILTDGFSFNIMLRDFCQLYNGAALRKPDYRFRDYIVWQAAYDGSEQAQKQQEYWLDQYKTIPAPLNLPLDFPRPSKQTFEGAVYAFPVGGKKSKVIHSLAKRNNTTVFNVLITAVAVLLYKYCFQEEFVIGTPYVGRASSDFDDVVGMFINTLPLKIKIDPDATMDALLQRMKEHTIQAFANGLYPFESLVDKVVSNRDLSRNPLFDVMVILQNNKRDIVECDGAAMIPIELETTTSKFDCTFDMIEVDDRFYVHIEYNTALFQEETIKRMALHFLQTIESAMLNPEKTVSEIDILTVDEHRQLREEYQSTEPAEHSTSFVETVRRQCACNPEKPAIHFHEKTYSYRETCEWAERIAALLHSYGFEKNQVIAIVMHRTEQLLFSILGTLFAGCAYVPIDPSYPQERIEYMLENSNASCVLTEHRYEFLQKAFPDKATVVYLDREQIPATYATRPILYKEEDLAYILFTSGSTGNPKGVMISQSNLIHFLNGIRKAIPFTDTDKILCLTTVSFDIFVLESLLPLYAGMQIVLADDAVQSNMHAILDLIKEQQVDIVQATPSRLQLLADCPHNQNVMQIPRVILSGGDTLTSKTLEKLKSVSKAKIYNLYGPTEATVWVTAKDLTDTDTVTIGKPLNNTRVYVLDANLHLLPVGVTGEIYLAGPGVSPGYYENESVTAERFIPDYYKPAEKMYRTGDYGKWLPNGEIVLHGRVDGQVKMNGFRIELGDIRAAVIQYPGVEDAWIQMDHVDENAKRLVAYIACKAEISIQKLQSFLQKKIPQYMMPSKFVVMEDFPRTPNGKLDTSKLKSQGEQVRREQYAPHRRTGLEQQILDIWVSVLGTEDIDVDDDFFTVGGNSLIAIKLEYQLETANLPITVQDIYQHRSIASLAEALSGEKPPRSPHDPPETMTARKEETSGASSQVLQVQPFNDVFYKSCFYNALFAVMRYNGHSILPILLNDLFITQLSFENDAVMASVETVTFMDLERLLASNELFFTKVDHGVAGIISALEQGTPVMVGVDCYELPKRKDTYQTLHWQHFLVVKGYDPEQKIFYMLDHDHMDNLTYQDTAITADDLARANTAFDERFSYAVPGSVLTLSHQDHVRMDWGISCIFYYRNAYLRYRKKIQASIDRIKDTCGMMGKSTAEKVVCDDHLLKQLNQIIVTRQAEFYRNQYMMNGSMRPQTILDQLVASWTKLRNLIVKRMIMDRPEIPTEQLRQSLVGIYEQEKAYHNAMCEFMKE